MPSSGSNTKYDAIIIGGGPAGATAGLVLARSGLKALIIERAKHPRFHIGESFLPRNKTLLQELGLFEKLCKLPHMVKEGAEFAIGNSTKSIDFRFDQGFPVGETTAWNIERAAYDAMILDSAREAGAEVLEGPTVRAVPVLRDGEVQVDTDSGNFQAKWLFDASGQSAVLGRLLKTRRVLEHHQKVAYFGHFTGVFRHAGSRAGYPMVVMCDEGWFWLIPIDDRRTSIGIVMDAGAAKRVPVAPNQTLRWAISRSPVLRERTANATFPESNGVCADFSYRCEPYAGPGYFLLGDAAMFVDPIFSTGVCLGMMGGKLAAESVAAIVQRSENPEAHRARYIRYLKNSSRDFFRLIDLYYRHSFRELFLHGQGPVQMPQAIISILAGHVFPKPRFGLIWRMRLFEFFVRLHKHFAIAPRLQSFSLMQGLDDAHAVELKPTTPTRAARA